MDKMSDDQTEMEVDKPIEEKMETVPKPPQPAVLPPPGQSQLSTRQIEQLEEQKLRDKFPQQVRPRGGGHSMFLQKRLAKGQKYFDSGDYQMAKQKSGPSKSRMPPPMLAQATGEAIPTPDSIRARKTSLNQQQQQTKIVTNLI